jgi:selenide,water dikinase
MAALNRTASEAGLRHGVRAATDVTGFGLVGHALAVARESRVTLELHAAELPLLPHAQELAPGFQAGGLKANRQEFEPQLVYRGALDAALQALLFDPQTSGGLLLLVPESHAWGLLAELPEARVIGVVRPRGEAPIVVF